MSSTGGGVSGIRSKTASVIVVGTAAGSHDLKVEGYSNTKGYLNGEYIKAEDFAVGGHNWYMRYYPNGCCSNDNGWVTFFLYHDGSNGEELKVLYKISLLDQEGNPVPSHVNSNITPNPSAQQSCTIGLIKRKDMDGSAYLRDDSFSVRCEFTMPTVSTESVQPIGAVPASDMLLDLGRLFSGGVWADVKFEVGEETFDAHKCVLAARSSVFMAEFFGQMKETTANRVQIDGMEARVFKAMLHFVYTDSVPQIDDCDLVPMTQHLLIAADRYNLRRLKLVCEDKLRGTIDTSTVASTLALAEQQGSKTHASSSSHVLEGVSRKLRELTASRT